MATVDEECRHLLPPGQCDLCRALPPGVLARGFRTKGGLAYHNDPDCGALLDGQAGARRRRQRIHPVEAISWAQVMPGERDACQKCCTVAWVTAHRDAMHDSMQPANSEPIEPIDQMRPCEVLCDSQWIPGKLVWDRRREDGLWWATVHFDHDGAACVEVRSELQVRPRLA